jgi:putative ABC transport system ATP-binding protein
VNDPFEEGCRLPPIVEIDSVTKSYGPTAVLRGVSLSIEKGRFISLMGASGSGKTTLLNIIGALDAADSGIVRVCGEELQRLDDGPRSAFRLRRIGFVFQFFNLLPHLSVQENIALPLLFLGERESSAKARAAAVADEVGLGGKLARPINQLSGGEMQRVGLARALVHGPQLILADEPTGNLDSKTGTAILELIRRSAKDHGATVIMATHDPKSTEFCDETIHVADGEIAAAKR